MKKLAVLFFALSLIPFTSHVFAANGREEREILMAEDAIFWSLLASASERSRNECSKNFFACSDDRADLGLSLLGQKKSPQAIAALTALVRYRLDGGISSSFTCFVMLKKNAAQKSLIEMKPAALRRRCESEWLRATVNHPALTNDVATTAVCSSASEIELKRRELIRKLRRGITCAVEDF